MIGPVPLQHQIGTSVPAAETSPGMAQMALEDEAVMPHQRNARAVPTPRSRIHLAHNCKSCVILAIFTTDDEIRRKITTPYWP